MKANIKSILLIICLLSSFARLHSNMAIYNYTLENGLIGPDVKSIAQDKNGYLWFSTNNGICTYDGYKWNCNVFPNFNDISFSEICIDETNRFWGISIQGKSIIFLDLNNPNNSLPTINISHNSNIVNYNFHLINTNGKITAVFSDTKNNLWVFSKDKWRYYNLNIDYDIKEINTVSALSDRVLIGTDKGLFEIRNSGIHSLNYILDYSGENVLALTIEKANKNNIWIFTNKYLGVINDNKLNIIKPFAIEDFPENINNSANNYFIISNFHNRILYGTNNYLKIFKDKSTPEILINSNSGLLNNEINSVFLDRENILWIATTEGISKIPSLKFQNLDKNDNLLESSVSALLEINKDKYIIGHPRGFTIVEKNKENVHIKLNNQKGQIFRIVKNKKGEIYAAAKDLGIIRLYDNNTISFIPPEKLGVNRVVSIAIDSNQNLLYSDYKSVFKYNNNGISRVYEENNNRAFRDIFVTKSNRIIITTLSSGIFYQKDYYNFVNIFPYDSIGKSTYSVFEKNGITMIGTNNGLYYLTDKYLLPSMKFQNHLRNEKVYAIVASPKNEIWLGTSNGIKNICEKSFKTYSSGSGIISIDVNRAALIYNSDKNLMIGTNRGLSISDNSFESLENIKPIINLTNIEVNNVNYPLNQDLDLDYHDNNLIYTFSVPSFYFENQNIIYYKLIPLDNSFIEQKYGNSNTIRFQNLNPGKYKLVVIAKNSIGISSDEITISKISISPHFHSSFWFILLLISALFVVIYIVVRHISNQSYKRLLENEVARRTEELEASKSRYMSMFYNNNAMMIIIDPDTLTITEANPPAVNYFNNLGYSFYKGDSLLKAGGPISVTKDEIKSVLSKQKEADITFAFNINDSIVIRSFMAYSTTIYQDGKEFIYIIFSDITAQKNAESKLKLLNENLETKVQERTKELEDAFEIVQNEILNRMNSEADLLKAKDDLELSLEREKELNKLKSQFILMISHEYRTPLTVIYSSTEIIKEFINMNQAEISLKYIDRIQQSVDLLTALMDNSLKIGEDTHLKLNYEEFDLNDFIYSCIDEFNIKSNYSHNINVKKENGQLIIKQDRNAIRQALNNIVDNAMKFSMKGTDINIRDSVVDNNVYIEIQDFGIGMNDYTIDRVFDLFYKSNNTIGLYPGIGLGMTLAKKYINAINGEITIESELEKGTTVTIKIPINLD